MVKIPRLCFYGDMFYFVLMPCTVEYTSFNKFCWECSWHQRITAERYQGSSRSDCSESGNLVFLEIKFIIDTALIAKAFAFSSELAAAGSPLGLCCTEREPGSLPAPLLPELSQLCQPLQEVSAGTLG